jgi:hypothetical protein
MQIKNNCIKKIKKIRENNNILWCKILDLAFEKSPDEAKVIFKQITENDQKINELSRDLCK